MESIQSLLEQASQATIAVKVLSDDEKADILRCLAAKIRENTATIIAENKLDLDRMPDTDPKKDRLLLSLGRIEDLAKSVEDIAALPDPSNRLISERMLDNGLFVQKITIPSMKFKLLIEEGGKEV